MMTAPLSFDELAARLKTAALMELAGANHMEMFCARSESPSLRALTLGEAERQAEALALAHKIALALARNPRLALGLGLEQAEALPHG